MIDALKRCAEPEAARLRNYLRQSNETLWPLGEPLLIDFGLHRWLKEEREEAYSDWLAWIVAQLSDAPERVFQLFGIRKAVNQSVECSLAISVDRETPARLAPEENSKRLDLLLKVKCGKSQVDRELYIIEVKVTDPESADTAKQRHYYKWLQQQPEIERRETVLVALEGENDYYEGFRLFTWRNLCIELRKIVKTVLLKEKPIVAALALAFVGAVEQNLCGVSPTLAQRVIKGEVPPLIPTDISDHLERFLGLGRLAMSLEHNLEFFQEGLSSYMNAMLALKEFHHEVQEKSESVLKGNLQELGRALDMRLEAAAIHPYAGEYDGAYWIISRLTKIPGLYSSESAYFGLRWREIRGEAVPGVAAGFWFRSVPDRDAAKSAFGRGGDGLSSESPGLYFWEALTHKDAESFEEKLDDLVKKWIELWKKAGGLNAVVGLHPKK
jgi:hypothetical protein